ncbi:MAG TPA: hybrid sensor histidine kinase/response regulator [Coleofasciculaceae cyanobacterium]
MNIQPPNEQQPRSTVLIVDDNPTNLNVLSDLLDGAGLDVRVAKSGVAALDRVAFAAPDLILLDVMMPEMDGFEACRRLQNNPQTCDIPIIFMTALSETTDKVKGLNLGAVDYITKPFQQEEVLARVRLHLKLRHLNQALANANNQLEEKVAERTAKLEQALQDLKTAQVRLIQTEQLSSLGDLTDGAAYEISNSVNFLNGNLTYVGECCEELIAIAQLYRIRDPEPDGELQKRLQTCDLDFLQTDLPTLLASLQTGTRRIQNIADILHDFAQPGDSIRRAFHLNASLDNILILLKNRLKGRGHRPLIAIQRNYNDLLPIQGYPGPLNQALTNVITNAIDAIEARFADPSYSPLMPEIQIHTSLHDRTVHILIKDNGIGMTDEVRQHVFQPFFTTKPATKSTGLGLALCHTAIVELHGGTIECRSQLGQGTEIIMALPLEARSPAQ